MAWVFQGNPNKFPIEDYLSRYPELIYWRTPRYAAEIKAGDRAYIWRAGKHAGFIATGTVVEAPTASGVEHPEALGEDLWWSEKPDPDEPNTGICLEEIRLTAGEGLVPRAAVKENELLLSTTLIRMPNGTVFRLTNAENLEMGRLWGLGPALSAVNSIAATEGQKRLYSHYKRERSDWLKTKKLEADRKKNGKLSCELCGTEESSVYPPKLGSQIFEVRHLFPLSAASTPTRTTLEDLAVLCASCHRVVHADTNVEYNFKTLQEHFAK
jgi:hypothetical protein